MTLTELLAAVEGLDAAELQRLAELTEAGDITPRARSMLRMAIAFRLAAPASPSPLEDVPDVV